MAYWYEHVAALVAAFMSLVKVGSLAELALRCCCCFAAALFDLLILWSKVDEDVEEEEDVDDDGEDLALQLFVVLAACFGE